MSTVTRTYRGDLAPVDLIEDALAAEDGAKVIALREGLESIRLGFDDPEVGDLLSILVTSASVAEADLALVGLAGRIDERALVRAVNLREAFAAMPATPCDMAVDAETLARVAGLKRRESDLRCAVGRGLWLVVRAEGNRCLDLILEVKGERIYWTPAPHSGVILSAEALAAVLAHPRLLEAVTDVALAMGLVMNPTIYLSLEDWHLEHASAALEQLAQMF